MSMVFFLWIRKKIIRVLNHVSTWNSIGCILTRLSMNLLTWWKTDCLCCMGSLLDFTELINGFTLFATVGISWRLTLEHTIVLIALLPFSAVHRSMISFFRLHLLFSLALLPVVTDLYMDWYFYRCNVQIGIRDDTSAALLPMVENLIKGVECLNLNVIIRF
jgi:hypothetical protein